MGARQQITDPKYAIIRSYLDTGMTMVTVDTRVAGTAVPAAFRGQTDLRLNLSLSFRAAAMEFGTDALHATLTFGGHPFRCRLPWAAIREARCTVDGRQVTWLVAVDGRPDSDTDQTPADRRAAFRVIRGGKS